MEGPRITESGDVRVTEASDRRVTEGFIEGFASLNGVGSVDALANFSIKVSASLTSDGSVLLVGESTLFGRLDLNASSSVVFDGDLVANGLLDVSASSLISSSAVRIQYGFANFSSSGSLASEAGFKFVAESSVSFFASMSAAQSFIADGKFGGIVENYVRLTESGDTRVTEESNVRITGLISQNEFVASLVTSAERRAFSQETYAKYDGDWLDAIPYVKYDGAWSEPDKIYKNINGNWKRIA